jgi:hypothetical protein
MENSLITGGMTGLANAYETGLVGVYIPTFHLFLFVPYVGTMGLHQGIFIEITQCPCDTWHANRLRTGAFNSGNQASNGTASAVF